jgi:hypothetical protein
LSDRGDVMDMAELRGWRQGRMFSFCSPEVKPLPPTGNLFFRSGRPARFFAGAGRVDVGEKDRKAEVFCEPNWPSAASAPIRR